MNFSLTWLKEVLLEEGLKVAPEPGWETRGNKGRDVGPIQGVICHHTGTNAGGNMPTLKMLINGRSDLSGPLAQLGLGRDGTFYLIAAGRCNHAGKGAWRGITTGNTNFIGIEAENRGTHSDPWPEVQLEAYRHGVAAILRHLDLPADMCCGHKEYAKPDGRKNDPLFDMNEFREVVDRIIKREIPKPNPIPSREASVSSGKIARPTLRRNSSDVEFVKQLQEKLGVVADGHFGPKTEASVRQFQRSQGLVDDGIVGPKTWIALDNPATPIQLTGTHSNNISGNVSEFSQTSGTDIRLGRLSAKFETGNRGPGTVSTGIGDRGGVSYGSYQMTSKPNGGTAKVFVKGNNFKWKNEFEGLIPGEREFSNKWRDIANKERDAFHAAQHEFIKQTHYDPLMKNIKANNGLDLTTHSNALKDVIWSTAVQHGPNNKIVSNALENMKKTGRNDPANVSFDEHLIEAIYDERGRKNSNGDLVFFSRNSRDVQKGVANRFVSERADALKMLKNGN
ncbi:MAG: N-acetylmuramoyl-L-alanine amidase [Methylococcaceae bacterium]|nr:N-acetylmuramoyl-L-alanine amidase [Methylococcaceae bacterium]